MVIAVNYMRELFNVFEKAACINVYSSGDIKAYKSGSDVFKGIMKCWNEMIEGAYDMPAFGVSLHADTLEAMKSGRWIEFEFPKKLEYNGMTFEKLLIQVVSGYKGFNLIRYNTENGYSGRCYFFNLVDRDMSNFSDFLANLA